MNQPQSASTLPLPLQVQNVALPKGGGAITGLREVAQTNPHTGSLQFSFPLPDSSMLPGPGLQLTGGTSGGNGPFGLGLDVSVPQITRSTLAGVPHYNQDDTYQYGSENLIPIQENGKVRYRLRNGADTHWIEQLPEGGWRVIDPDHRQLYFGVSSAARLADPADPSRIFSWLLEETVTAHGAHVRYEYKADTTTTSPTSFTQCYLKRVGWGNSIGSDTGFVCSPNAEPTNMCWLYELVFDYDDQYTLGAVPFYEEIIDWNSEKERKDPFSRFRTGFAVRTRFLCRAVRLYVHEAATGTVRPVAAMMLEYDENPVLTQLRAIESQGFEEQAASPGNAVQWIPVPGVPVEFGYQTFVPGRAASFQPFDAMPSAVTSAYQLVDLYGEGVPGVLWQISGRLWYQEPLWDEQNDTICYGDTKPVDLAPYTGRSPLNLIDIDGDGRLEAVLTEGSCNGFFGMCGKQRSDNLHWASDWREFVPFQALPVEFSHPQAQLIDLSGNGLADVALIGPNSVRLYANTGNGQFAAPQTVDAGTITLPVMLTDGTQLVAFSDLLGSGTQHLIRITAHGVEYWPNLGHGRFGERYELAIVDRESTWARYVEVFNPDHVLLADIDGSGATDILYIQPDKVHIWLNESGNRLRYGGAIKLPVPYDNLCQIHVADVYGNGTACLVMSRLYMTPQHWLLDWCEGRKPYLMHWVANNRGGYLSAQYSNSTQFWLRDKARTETRIWSEVPFPVPVVQQFKWVDEITQTTLTQSFEYSQGYYDGVERMFCGFGKVTQSDAQYANWSEGEVNSAPLRVVSWFHTGNPAIWQREREDFVGMWKEASLKEEELLQAPPPPVILSSQQKYEALSAAERYQTARALRGSLLRQESYGEDKDEKIKNTPFTVAEHRYAIRFDGENAGGGMPRSAIVFASVQITDTVDYDRLTRVYRHQRTKNIEWDRHGYVSKSEEIAYPRSGEYDDGKEDPYQDPQQFERWCTHHTISYAHQAQDAERWSLGAVTETRTTTQKNKEPAETTAWQCYTYWDPEKGKPLPQGQAGTVQLIDQIKTAYFKADQLETVIAGTKLQLDDAEKLLGDGKLTLEDGYYWQPSSHPTYDTLSCFYRVKEIQDPFGHPTQYDYSGSPHPSVLSAVTDAVENCSKVIRYHPCFLTPVALCDPNNNVQEVLLDPFGRVCTGSFYGTEVDLKGQLMNTGFAPLSNAHCPKPALDEAMRDPLSVLQSIVSDKFVAQIDLEYLGSWMGSIDVTQGLSPQEKTKLKDILPKLIERGWVDKQKRFRARFTSACKLSMSDLPDDERLILKRVWEDSRFPTAMASIVASLYDPKACDLRVALSYFDGLGRPLMAKARVEEGEAFLHQRLPQKGHSFDRWLTSGKVLYNNKGQPVRQYHPYYIDTHRYQADVALNTGESDTLFYDPMGRLIKTHTAAGYLRKAEYHPWYTASYDENDLLDEQVSSQELK